MACMQTLTFEVCTGEFSEPYHHWNLVSTIGCKENHFELYDSLYSSNIASDTAAFNASLLHSSSDTVEVKIIDVQRKANGSDCGVLSIAFMTVVPQLDIPF